MSRRLGEILIKIGVIDEVQMAAGISRMEQWGGNLLSHLVQARMVSEESLVDALAQRFRYEVAHPLPLLIERTVLDLLPGEFCEKLLVLPIGIRPNDHLLLAVSDPSDLATIDTVRAKVSRQVDVAVAGPKSLARAIESHYFGGSAGSGTPDPFSAGADSFGSDGLFPSVGDALSPPNEIERTAGDALPPVLEPVAAAPVGDGYLAPDEVAPRLVTGSRYLSDNAEMVEVGDLFSDPATPQSDSRLADTPEALFIPGAPAEDVETNELVPEDPAAAQGAVRSQRGNEMPADELPMQSGEIPRSLQSIEGDVVVVAAEAASERAAERMEAPDSAIAQARAAGAAREAAPAATHSMTVAFGTPVSPAEVPGTPLQAAASSAEAASVLKDIRSISPTPPAIPDPAAVLSARCEALEMRLAHLTQLLVEKGVLGEDDL